MPSDHRAVLAKIKRFDQLIAYLRDEMGWPIARDSFEDVNDLFYDFTADELGIDPKTATKIESIKRLRPLSPRQRWGIFFVKFEPKKLPVVALRRILSRVALKKRASANSAERAAWAADDLLFVSNYGEGDERQISFAHFSQDRTKADLPILKVLGWNDRDTALHLDGVATELATKLSWPEDESDVDRWREKWRSAFTLRPDEVIKTSKALAVELAKLARKIRDRIRTVLAIETETGPVTKLMKAFQEALVHNLDAGGFADMYAQTIAYGLLSARVTNPKADTADGFAAQLPVTNPFLKELMETFLHVGGRKRKAGRGPWIDFDELGVSEVVELLDDTKMEAVVRDFGDRNPHEDPVIHFYELFLKEYDPRQKLERGVFYTPKPVVSYIVRSVHELLQTEFGLTDGLADTATWGDVAQRVKGLTIPAGVNSSDRFVMVLDPAVGTGTFLVETIDVIRRTLVDKWNRDGHGEKKILELWNDHVARHLLPCLHGYELLMAPYAIAHLKIGLKLHETGYRFTSDQRARVYLTDSLEPHQDFSGRLAFDVPALAHEAKSVNEVKAKRGFTVIVGNPPYLREKLKGPGHRAERIGGWVRYGDRTEARAPLFDDFIKPLATLNKGVHAKLAYELSVMFWRVALWLAFEKRASPGIVGMISPRAYISGPGHLGMRKRMRDDATEIWVTDLGGDNRGTRKSENIFDIETGVAIGLCVKAPGRSAGKATVHYAEIRGTAEEKLATLGTATSLAKRGWVRCPPGSDAFLPGKSSNFGSWPKLTDLFPWQHSGSQFKRLWPIAETRELLEKRWRHLVSLPPGHRGSAFVETDARVVAAAKPGAHALRFTGIAEEGRGARNPRIDRYTYRTLDRQWAFIDERFADRLRPAMVAVLGPKQVFAATLMSKTLGAGPAVTVTNHLPDLDVFCNRGAKDIIPLWRDAGASQANITAGLLDELGSRYGHPVAPEEFFAYCVAVLAGPTYVETFEAELATPGPHIPVAEVAALFHEGASLGARYVWLQT